jgi:hypothetical protein
MVDNRNVSRNELCKMPVRIPVAYMCSGELTVLEDGAVGQIYPGALVCDNDDRATESDLAAEPHITRNCKMVKLEDVGYSTEALLEVRNLRAGSVKSQKADQVMHAPS